MISATVVIDLEVDQRLDTDPADFLHILHAGDAMHDGAENDRRDQHLDQLDEGIAERLHRCADLGVEVPEQDAEHDRHEDLHVEMLVPGGRRVSATCGHCRCGHRATSLPKIAVWSGSRPLPPPAPSC